MYVQCPLNQDDNAHESRSGLWFLKRLLKSSFFTPTYVCQHVNLCVRAYDEYGLLQGHIREK